MLLDIVCNVEGQLTILEHFWITDSIGSRRGALKVGDAGAHFKWKVNSITTYVKQKKSVVEPTRKKVAADTGTYRDGRRGLLCGTTAWGSGDEDGTRPPLWLLPPGITSCVVSATATACHSELLSVSTTGLWGQRCCGEQNVRHVNERALSITWEEEKNSSNSAHQGGPKVCYGLFLGPGMCVRVMRDLKIKHWADVKALVFQSEL